MSDLGGIQARIRTNNLDNIQNADLKNILDSSSVGKLVKGDSGLEVKSGVLGFMSKVAGFFGFKSEENKTAKQEFLKNLEREFNLSPNSAKQLETMVRPADKGPLTVVEAKKIMVVAGLLGLYDETRMSQDTKKNELPQTRTDGFKQAVEQQVQQNRDLPPDTGPLPPMENEHKKELNLESNSFFDQEISFFDDIEEPSSEPKQLEPEQNRDVPPDTGPLPPMEMEHKKELNLESNNFFDKEINFFDDIEEPSSEPEKHEPETMDKMNDSYNKRMENIKARNDHILRKVGLKSDSN